MSRPMTPQEKAQFKSWFPKLNVDTATVTGEATTVYNCISWTVGVTDRWLWPGASLTNFDGFYRQWGCVRSNNGPIAAWGLNTSNMTHGCVSGDGHGPRWESKCGSSLRIQHGLIELESSSYGHVIAFYNKVVGVAAPFAEAHAALLSAKEEHIMKLSPSYSDRLKQETESVSKEIAAKFHETFAAWKNSWFTGSLSIDSNPYSRAKGREFDALVELGPQVLPLIVEKLIQDDNFFSLVIYDALQSDVRFIVEYASDDPRLLEGEQGRAIRVVKTWLSR
jgi:hypothetical protein